MKKYIIVKNLNNHGFDIGQVVTVVHSHAGGYQATAVKGETPNNNWVSSQEIESAPVSDTKKGFIGMIFVVCIIGLMLYATGAHASGYEPYLKIGVGYKFSETRYFDDYRDGSKFYIEFDDPLAARFEAGLEKGNLSFGIAHYSNWRTGWPFNDKGELQNTQIFIDYKLTGEEYARFVAWLAGQ